MANAATRSDIIKLVVMATGAAPGTTVLGELVTAFDGGKSLAMIAADLTASASFRAKYPVFATPEEFSTEFLSDILPGIDAAIIADVVPIAVGILNSGGTRGDILLAASQFLSTLATDDPVLGSQAALFQNQVDVAEFHTVTLELDTGLDTAISGVTADPATVDAAKVALDPTYTPPVEITAAAAASVAAAAAADAAVAAAVAATPDLLAISTAYDAALTAASATDAAALKVVSDASTAAATAATADKAAKQTALDTAKAALTAAVNANPVVTADVNTANANVIVAQAALDTATAAETTALATAATDLAATTAAEAADAALATAATALTDAAATAGSSTLAADATAAAAAQTSAAAAYAAAAALTADTTDDTAAAAAVAAATANTAAAATAATDYSAAVSAITVAAAQPGLNAAAAAALTAYNTAAAAAATAITAAQTAQTAADTAEATAKADTAVVADANAAVTAAATFTTAAAAAKTAADAAAAAAATLATATAATTSTADDAGATAATTASAASVATASGLITAAATQTTDVAGLPATFVPKTFQLTAGIDKGAAFTGGVGKDTFIGNTSSGASAVTLTSLDEIDGGAGSDDTLTISATVPVDTTAAVGVKVSNIEVVELVSTGAVTTNTTAWTGVSSLTTSSYANVTITAAATTNVTSAVASPTGAGAYAITGGNNVTVTMNDTIAALGTASGNTGTITGASGAVVVSQTETFTADDAAAGASASTTGSISVTSGTSATVNSLATIPSTGDDTGDAVTIGQVTVTNTKGTMTFVNVTQSAAITGAAATTPDLINGVVDITDQNSAGKADSITSVTLANFGNSEIDGNALTTLTLTGGSAANTASGTFEIKNSAGLAATATTLQLNMLKGRVGVITDTPNRYKALNIDSAAASTIAGLDFTEVTTLAVSGAGVTTITAQTDLAKATTITSTGGGLTLGGNLGTGVTFSGGDGKETIDLAAATTKAVTLGGGDDKVTLSGAAAASLPTSTGSINGGGGTDTLAMQDDEAEALSTATFNTRVSGFEVLELSTGGTNGENVDLSTLNDISSVRLAGITTLTLNDMASGGTLTFTGASTSVTANITNAAGGTTDVLNIAIPVATTGAVAIGSVTAANVETINIDSSDVSTAALGAVAAVNTATLITAAAKSVVVTGNNGLNITNDAGNTAITSFDASGVVAKGSGDTQVLLAVTFDSVNATASAVVTITGGAGNDALTGDVAKDTFVLSAGGSDTVSFNQTLALNGVDTVNNFTAGAVTATGAADVLNLNLATGVVLQDENASASSIIFTANSTNTTGDLTLAGSNVEASLVITGTATLDASNVKQTGTAANGEIIVGDGISAYVLQAESASSTVFNVYRAFDSDGTGAVVPAIELLGTVNMTNAVSAIVAGNIS